ncbi:hypothetical protein [Streptomyces kaniharaensis]|uniref:hypothetical protein n=1 Tax=Streptomyces kaniharaensis TaxID=212423 RepID=UPI0018A873B2|nr:hypothetical protein [Streptomyces kaniharaensis]
MQAIRQARGPAGGADRQRLVENWRILSLPHLGREAAPAARAAGAWYLERVADLDPVTAPPPARLTNAQRTRWCRAAAALQRDLLVRAPALHQGRIEEFTRRAAADDPFPETTAPETTEHDEAVRRRMDGALAGALEHLPLTGAVREGETILAADSRTAAPSTRCVNSVGRRSGTILWRSRSPDMLKNDLPVEPDRSRWFPLWGAPEMED